MTGETRRTWAQRVRRWKRSGLGAREFTAGEGVKGTTLWGWSSALRGASAAAEQPTFIEVAAPPRVPTRPSALEVVVRDGVRVVVPLDFDESHLRRLLRAVEVR